MFITTDSFLLLRCAKKSVSTCNYTLHFSEPNIRSADRQAFNISRGIQPVWLYRAWYMNLFWHYERYIVYTKVDMLENDYFFVKSNKFFTVQQDNSNIWRQNSDSCVKDRKLTCTTRLVVTVCQQFKTWVTIHVA